MFAGLFEAKSAAATAKGATGKKKAAAPKKGESNDSFTAKGPAQTMGSGLSKKQRRKQRQREQKRGADQTTACTSTGTSSGVHEKAGGSAIQRKMAAQLAGAHFRQINEELYTTESADAVELFRKDPGFFEIYHAGFRSQSAHWPVRPVDVLVRWLEKQPASLVVGDLGCGDAQIAASVRQTVHSFDLVANNPRVTACDVANVPLPSGALDVAIFCLALMGTNYVDYVDFLRTLAPADMLIEDIVAGTTYENREIRGIKVLGGADPIDPGFGVRPSFVMHGCHHSGEWITASEPAPNPEP